VREMWMVHAVLFLVVLLLVTITGAVIADALPGDFSGWSRERLLHALPSGLWFSLPLLAILLCHELGHYLTARHYQLNVSPPFFIPGLPAPLGIGTFGAFIRLRTIVSDRRQLLDVGAAGPIAGFVVALAVLWLGLAWLSVTWLFWGVVVLLLSRGRLDHPPVLDAYRPLPRSRGWMLLISLVLFVLTFAPVPVRR